LKNIFLPSEESWHLLNKKIHSSLGLSTNLQLRVQSHPVATLIENFLSCNQFQPHKKGFVVIKGLTGFLEPVLNYFSKEGYLVVSINIFDHIENGKWKNFPDFVKLIPKDCTFVFSALDHQLTGEEFLLLHDLNDYLNSQKIYFYLFKHFSFDEVGWEKWIKPYTFLTQIVDQQFSFSVYGLRCKFQNIFSQFSDFSFIDESFIENFTEDFSNKPQNTLVAGLIDQLYRELPVTYVAHNYFFKSKKRILIYAKERNSDAIMNYLRINYQIQVQSISGCSLGLDKKFSWCDSQEVSTNYNNGFLLESTQLNKIGIKSFVSALEEVYKSSIAILTY
jgi:hypothetical protein